MSIKSVGEDGLIQPRHEMSACISNGMYLDVLGKLRMRAVQSVYAGEVAHVGFTATRQ